MPRRLIGGASAYGPIPARIAPVFRDRDELATAQNLSEKIEDGLRQSETLIVVCSPAARTSRWVNEEIRRFREMGRGDRIFCMLADGNASDREGHAACFPSALLESSGSQTAEPLAADPRKWADGKRLALLKLVAGVLGIRLDDLRQRDKARQRKWRAVIALAGLATLALAAIAVQSRISEQLERARAEQLATFVVDLGERVQSDVDLETQAVISAEAMKHLELLDPDRLSRETSIKVGLATRQMGHVNEGQGHPAEALEAYSRSRSLFRDLSRKYPDDLGVMFELSQSEFYVGSLHFDRSEYALAQQPFQDYHAISRRLLDEEPENPDWIAELSYSVTSLAALRLKSDAGVDAELLAELDEALALLDEAMAHSPNDLELVGHYATTLAWAADAQMNSCQLNKALAMRLETRDYAAQAANGDPSDNNLKVDYAYAITGVALVQMKLGRVESAENSMLHTVDLLEGLLSADASNIVYRQEFNWRQFMLATVYADTGRLSQALELMARIEPGMIWLPETEAESHSTPSDYIQFLVSRADMQSRVDQRPAARQSLSLALDLVNQADPSSFSDTLIARARFLGWELNGADPAPELNLTVELPAEITGPYRACEQADLYARLSIMSGQRDRAIRQVAYLIERSYAEPSFIRFCQQYGLCQADGD